MFKILQMGRAVAALGVCAFHLSLAFNQPGLGNARIFFGLTQYGRFGVDFFFALSGFIIFFAHYRDIDQPQRLGRYGVKRFFRIYPMYWLLTAIMLAGLVFIHHQPLPSGGDAISIASLIQFNPVIPPLLPSWTLYHEIFFYGVFACLIINRFLGCFVFAGWMGLIVFSGANPLLVEHGFTEMMLMPMNLCFFAGMAVYFVYQKLSKGQALACVLGGLFVLFGVQGFVDELRHAVLFSGLMSAAFFLLLSGAIAFELRVGVRNIPLLTLIGNASYALYLAHPMLQNNFLNLWYVLGLPKVVGLPVIYGLTFVCTTGVAVCLHLLLEKPLLQVFNQLIQKLSVRHGWRGGSDPRDQGAHEPLRQPSPP